MTPSQLASIVRRNIARLTHSQVAVSESAADVLSKLGTEDFEPLGLYCNPTKEALIRFNTWLCAHRTSITGLCLYGSVVSASCSESTIKIPKDGHSYLTDSVVILPSDIDAIVVVSGPVGSPPTFSWEAERYNYRAERIDSKTDDLLGSVRLLTDATLRIELEKDRRLLPMYWRMMTEGGLWVRGAATYPSFVQDICGRLYTSTEDLRREAVGFYQRRCDALLDFQRQLLHFLLSNGFLYGEGDQD